MFDVFDAYLIGPEVAWNPEKWQATWLKNEPPGDAYRPRNDAKARLEKSRIASERPSLPLERFAGEFESKLYGRLRVRQEGGELALVFGQFKTPLTHWQGDSFYARTPTRLTFDWLLTFGASDGKVQSVTVKHIGWDDDEKDHVFASVRQTE
jgi:hypothetical protein